MPDSPSPIAAPAAVRSNVRRVLLLGTEGMATSWIRRALVSGLPDVHHATVFETPVSRKLLFERRAKRLGWRTALGQAAFSALAVPVLAREAAERLRQLEAETNSTLPSLPSDVAPVQHVASANDPAAHALFRQLAPDVTVLAGTRILSAATLEALGGVCLNLHAGITPTYRGVHGAYWACYDGRPDLAGSTVHVVDTGIDTGEVVEQVRIERTSRDNFVTYPLLQALAGLGPLVQAVRDALDGTLATKAPLATASQLRYHPTLAQYLAARLRRGVR